MTIRTTQAPLVIDVAGVELGKTDRRRLANPLVGGVIHFARNWVGRAQMTALNAEIKAIRPDILICVDHEGGRVQRFRDDGFTHLPSMGAIGRLWMNDAMKATQVAVACGNVLATELRACGIDFSFTPVLDLDYGESRVIGDRSFHRDARVVAMLARCLSHGLLRAGMGNCGKHFPGHGFVKPDSHVAIPVDRRSLKAILADDAQPYRWLGDTLDAVMAAHVIYPRIDKRAAGYSSKWLRDVLRQRLGFEGAIFTDDLSMEAARWIEGNLLTLSEAALAALEAGCDVALICNQSIGDSRVLDDVLQHFVDALADGRWVPDEAGERRRRALLPCTPAPVWNECVASASYRRARSLLAGL